MAVAPAVARPMPKPAMPCSQRGVLKTRSLPNLSCRLTVHLKTPPKATSSPKTTVVGSVASEISRALFTAWKEVHSGGVPIGDSRCVRLKGKV
ncbi:hypothetical protein TYRP_007281 [Tyrophagus putrescentiae]|nr:hypothetical protein TYRP_007281 [Tyrophagus putrescentiae]